jgi:segregation and condensation protein B
VSHALTLPRLDPQTGRPYIYVVTVEQFANHNGVPPAPPVLRQRARPRKKAGQEELPEPPAIEDLPAALESLLFVAAEPAEIATLARSLGVRTAVLERAAEELSMRLRSGGLRLQRAETRLQLVTAACWSQHVERFLGVAAEQPLSTAALETLAIIAYRQPVTRAAIEGIRGVGADRALATLRSRGLIEDVGRAEAIGRPVLYGTTMQFLEFFGLESLADLPPLAPSEPGE